MKRVEARDIDWQALERAENEGMPGVTRMTSHPAPNNELRRQYHARWLNICAQRVTPDSEKAEL